jgi:hypothetical protein
LLAIQSIQVIGSGTITEAEGSTYHVAFAFKEGLDRVVQLLYRNRHAAAEIGDLAGGFTKRPSRQKKSEDPRIDRGEVEGRLAGAPTSLELWG